MGVELDWEIDAADEQARQLHASGRPGQRRRRRLLALLLLLLPCVLVAAVLYLGWRHLEHQQENTLRATVEAEVTALRLGDERAFFELQHDGDQAWQLQQLEAFRAWQQRKLDGANPPGGSILALEQNGAEAWVQVEEIIDGEPWLHTWHYRLGAEGWRHVSALTGWRGVTRTHLAENLRIDHASLDEPLALALARTLDSWLAQGCALLQCSALPPLTVHIRVQEGAPRWASDVAHTLVVPAPWTGIRRADAAPDAGLQESLAALLAEHLLDDITGQPAADWTREARWLRESAAAWLANRLSGQAGGQHLLDSLAGNYGESAVARLLRRLRPDSTLGLLTDVTGTASPHEAALDWRDLLAWQLQQEAAHQRRADAAQFLALYDLRDEALLVPAKARLAVGEFTGPIHVDAVAPVTDPADEPMLLAEVRDQAGVRPVYFRLVNGSWLRAS